MKTTPRTYHCILILLILCEAPLLHGMNPTGQPPHFKKLWIPEKGTDDHKDYPKRKLGHSKNRKPEFFTFTQNSKLSADSVSLLGSNQPITLQKFYDYIATNKYALPSFYDDLPRIDITSALGSSENAMN